MQFICIFLITCEHEHFFHGSIGHYPLTITWSWPVPISWLKYFSCYWVSWALYKFWIAILCRFVIFLNIFSHSFSYHFTLLSVYSAEVLCSRAGLFSPFVYCWFYTVFGVFSKNPCLCQSGSYTIPPMFSSDNLMASVAHLVFIYFFH